MAEAMDDGGVKSKKKKQDNAVEKLVLNRDEKEEFVAWLSTQFGDTTFRAAFTNTKILARARALIRKSNASDGFNKAIKCLEHPATFNDCISGAVSIAKIDATQKSVLLRHWSSLRHAAKGSLKIIKRREKLLSSSSSSSSSKKKNKKAPRKHQSRHF
mmetsp:Transcript_19020/g.24658  ORF Transcript_19020/g.24658 Transcript_19020/m.24658 type:complete len:158 (-) Transcript_19020:98-571(-)